MCSLTVTLLSVVSVSGDVTVGCRAERDELESLTLHNKTSVCFFDGAPLRHMMESVGVK